MKLAHQAEASFITPRLRVFLSIDLIGSTDYKVRNFRRASADPEHWAKVLMHFYTDFHSKFLGNWNAWHSKYQGMEVADPCGPPPRLWKALGDELLFWKECWNPKEVVGVVQAWRQALIDFRKNWEHPELSFKIGAWVVGSPIRTWEVAFLRGEPQESDEPYLGDSMSYNFHLLKQYYDPHDSRKIDLDFVGPGMDCGFRLLGHSTEQKFVISADLAYILLQESAWWNRNHRGHNYPSMNFYFDGTTQLRGVTSGKIEYPLVWLDNLFGVELDEAQKFASSIAKITGNGVNHPKESELIDLLTEYLDEISGFPSMPYICRTDGEDIVEVLNKMPKEHKEKIESFRSVYISAAKKDRILSDSFAARPNGTEKTDEELQSLVRSVADRISNRRED